MRRHEQALIQRSLPARSFSVSQGANPDDERHNASPNRSAYADMPTCVTRREERRRMAWFFLQIHRDCDSLLAEILDAYRYSIDFRTLSRAAFSGKGL
jgi:hypothetical protein